MAADIKYRNAHTAWPIKGSAALINARVAEMTGDTTPVVTASTPVGEARTNVRKALVRNGLGGKGVRERAATVVRECYTAWKAGTTDVSQVVPTATTPVVVDTPTWNTLGDLLRR